MCWGVPASLASPNVANSDDCQCGNRLVSCILVLSACCRMRGLDLMIVGTRDFRYEIHTCGCEEGPSGAASRPPMASRPSASERPSDMRARPLLRLKRLESCSRIDERRPAPAAAPAFCLQQKLHSSTSHKDVAACCRGRARTVSCMPGEHGIDLLRCWLKSQLRCCGLRKQNICGTPACAGRQ